MKSPLVQERLFFASSAVAAAIYHGFFLAGSRNALATTERRHYRAGTAAVSPPGRPAAFAELLRGSQGGGCRRVGLRRSNLRP
jgi:hypothetical protein